MSVKEKLAQKELEIWEHNLKTEYHALWISTALLILILAFLITMLIGNMNVANFIEFSRKHFESLFILILFVSYCSHRFAYWILTTNHYSFN